jgi:hypothetical protein
VLVHIIFPISCQIILSPQASRWSFWSSQGLGDFGITTPPARQWWEQPDAQTIVIEDSQKNNATEDLEHVVPLSWQPS